MPGDLGFRAAALETTVVIMGLRQASAFIHSHFLALLKNTRSFFHQAGNEKAKSLRGHIPVTDHPETMALRACCWPPPTGQPSFMNRPQPPALRLGWKVPALC